MALHIIIDDSIRNHVPRPNAKQNKQEAIPDVVREVREALKTNAKQGFLVFISLANFLRLQPKISVKKILEACVKFVVFGGTVKKNATLKKTLYDRIDLRSGALTPAEVQFIIAREESCLREILRRKKKEAAAIRALLDTDRDQEDLIAIGRALSTEKDIDKLFRKILSLAQKITGADAGTIYIIEENAHREKQIRVKYSDTFSKKIFFEESVLPYNTGSIAGYVAVTGQVLNIPDVYRLTPDDPISFNPAFDYAHYYRSKSMLVVPMRNHFDEIIGVIQLLNSKENYHTELSKGQEASTILLQNAADFENIVAPFNPRYNRLLEAVANQAAIAIENTRMIVRIQHQFEEFVKASVFAIESRDEATSGHSFRVAAMCLKLADAITDAKTGPFAGTGFTAIQKKQIEYASLLHDYGKIYLDTRIFLKAKKLYPEDLTFLMQKLEIAWQQATITSLMREIQLLANEPEHGGTLPDASDTEIIAKEEHRREEIRKKILDVREKILTLNEPSVAAQDPAMVIAELVEILEPFQCRDLDGLPIELLSDLERLSLSVPKGSLNSNERKEVERHVDHTYNFVSKIPWPTEFERIPEIARAHHEMLDGSGYPRGIRGRDKIPLESRMIVIADVFDALTAHDRPYKKAVPIEKALDILAQEAGHGRIDPDLFALFREVRAWEEPALKPSKKPVQSRS